MPPRLPRPPRVRLPQARQSLAFRIGLAFTFSVSRRAFGGVVPHYWFSLTDEVAIVTELPGKPEPGIVPAVAWHLIKRPADQSLPIDTPASGRPASAAV